jgi:hypothetical protein
MFFLHAPGAEVGCQRSLLFSTNRRITFACIEPRISFCRCSGRRFAFSFEMADEAAVILLGLLEIRRYSCC